MIDVLASAFAARDLRFPKTASLILEQKLCPHAIFSLYSVAASDNATKAGAVVLLAGITARFNVGEDIFDRDRIRDMAMQLLQGGSFDKANRAAIRIVQAHWNEIQKGRSRSSGPSVSVHRQLGAAKGSAPRHAFT
jgi:hypothetical protein